MRQDGNKCGLNVWLYFNILKEKVIKFSPTPGISVDFVKRVLWTVSVLTIFSISSVRNAYKYITFYLLLRLIWLCLFRVTLADQTTYDAKVVGFDQDKDVAVLRIDAPKDKLRPIPVGVSADLLVGQKVFAIGNPVSLHILILWMRIRVHYICISYVYVLLVVCLKNQYFVQWLSSSIFRCYLLSKC